LFCFCLAILWYLCNNSAKLGFFLITWIFGMTLWALPKFLAWPVRLVGSPIRRFHRKQPLWCYLPSSRTWFLLSYIFWDKLIIGGNLISRTSWWFFNMRLFYI
jgi:hypothetical protein